MVKNNRFQRYVTLILKMCLDKSLVIEMASHFQQLFLHYILNDAWLTIRSSTIYLKIL